MSITNPMRSDGYSARLIDLCLEIVLITTVLLAPLLLSASNSHYVPPIIFASTSALALWILRGLASGRLTYLKTPLNLCLCLIFAIAVLHVLPLPRPLSQVPGSLSDWLEHPGVRSLLTAPVRSENAAPPPEARFGRLGLNAASGQRAFLTVAAMASLFWVIGNATNGRRRLHRLLWVAVIMTTATAVMCLIGSSAGDGQASHLALSPLLLGPPSASIPLLLTGVSLALALLLRLTMMAPTGWGYRSGRPWHYILRRPGTQSLGLILAIVLITVCIAAAAARQAEIPPTIVLLAVAATILITAITALWGRKIPTPRKRFPLLVLGCLLILAIVAVSHPIAATAGRDSEISPADGWTIQAANAWLELVRQGHWLRAAVGLGPLSIARYGAAAPAYGLPGQLTPSGGSGLAIIGLEWGIAGLAAAVGMAAFLAILLVGVLRRPLQSQALCENPRASGGFTAALSAGVLGALAGNLLYLLWSPTPLLPLNLMGLAVAGGLGLAIARSRGQKTGFSRRGAPAKFGQPWFAILTGTTVAIITAGLLDVTPAVGLVTSDKLAHLCAFGLLSLLMCRVLESQPTILVGKGRLSRLVWLWRPALAIMIVTALGVALEFGQLYMTENRQFEYSDIAADFLGALVMAGVWYFIYTGRLRPQAVEA